MAETIAPGQPTAAVNNSYSRKNPYLAELVRHERLTLEGSLKDTRHFVLQLGGSGISYTPGDSLATFGSNPPPLVDRLLQLLKFSADTSVKNSKGEITTVRETLLHDYTLNRANRKLLTGLEE